MIGALIGDIVGSKYEFNNHRSKEFTLLDRDCFFTDDSILSLAVAKAILAFKAGEGELGDLTVKYMREVGREYPGAGWGGRFRGWLFGDDPKPYGSYGNGSAMRVSACGFAAESVEEAIALSKAVTEVTHNHPEGIKGAEATAVAVYLAKTDHSILEIRDYINDNYYKIGFRLDEIRDSYEFNETCQDTVPQALEAFFESTSFEDAIRNAISIGGDSDTLAAITGAVAEAYYGVPTDIRKHALTFLDERLLNLLVEFENQYPPLLERSSGDKGSRTKTSGRKIKTGERGKTVQKAMQTADEELKIIEGSVEETSSQKLFAHLFEACNILRGPINQDEFKSYVTPLLFFKRISDVYDEETEDALRASGGDNEYASFPENHSFIIPEGCHWNDIRVKTKDIGEALAKAMSGIERANPDTLSGLFSSFDDANWTDKNKLSDERLKNLVEHMSAIKVGNKNYSADVMGDAYEYLIKKFADLSKKNAGEFYTPRSIVRMMVSLLKPKPGDTIYDPACGTGGMLIESVRQIGDEKTTYGKIYGQEKNLSTSAIARMNLFLHGAKDFKIVQGDTLRKPVFISHGKLQTFDCVIANPPFGLDKWGALSFETDPYGRNIWGSPTDSCADFAWLQHMVCSMKKDTGRCAVVLPQGVLFHSGKEGEMRQKLVESGKLECVIALAGGIFFSTGANACILLLNNKMSREHQGKVCLIDATEIVTPIRALKIMTDANVDEVLSLFSGYEDVEGKCKIVTIDEIAEAEFSLSMKAFIKQKREKPVPLSVAIAGFAAAVDETKKANALLEKVLTEGGYLDE